MAGDDSGGARYNRALQDHADSIYSSGGIDTSDFRVYAEEEMDSSGGHEAGIIKGMEEGMENHGTEI